MRVTLGGAIGAAVRKAWVSCGFVGFRVAALVAVLVSPKLGFAQEPDAVISKDAISVHRVERGTMTLRESAAGTITSLAVAALAGAADT
jgi:hypothetical protein